MGRTSSEGRAIAIWSPTSQATLKGTIAQHAPVTAFRLIAKGQLLLSARHIPRFSQPRVAHMMLMFCLFNTRNCCGTYWRCLRDCLRLRKCNSSILFQNYLAHITIQFGIFPNYAPNQEPSSAVAKLNNTQNFITSPSHPPSSHQTTLITPTHSPHLADRSASTSVSGSPTQYSSPNPADRRNQTYSSPSP